MTKDDTAAQLRTYPDGPILVRGDFQLLDEDGVPIDTSRRTIALCRCTRTAIPPFCDGTHTLPRADRSGQARSAVSS
jgi:CDGSH-type Zn-finger protein